MCGGIVWNLEKIPKNELAKYYTKEQIAKFAQSKKGASFFWDTQPTLPIELDGKTQLIPWGNRDNQSKMPKTGWAKAESIKAGKWKWLNPKIVKILADKGYEKGVWFDIPSGGVQGLVATLDKDVRAYMITKPASADYLKLTKHDREPIIQEL